MIMRKFTVVKMGEGDPEFIAINTRYIKSVSPFDATSCFITIDGFYNAMRIAMPFDELFAQLVQSPG
jgi:hypothetical protein